MKRSHFASLLCFCAAVFFHKGKQKSHWIFLKHLSVIYDYWIYHYLYFTHLVLTGGFVVSHINLQNVLNGHNLCWLHFLVKWFLKIKKNHQTIHQMLIIKYSKVHIIEWCLLSPQCSKVYNIIRAKIKGSSWSTAGQYL